MLFAHVAQISAQCWPILMSFLPRSISIWAENLRELDRNSWLTRFWQWKQSLLCLAHGPTQSRPKPHENLLQTPAKSPEQTDHGNWLESPGKHASGGRGPQESHLGQAHGLGTPEPHHRSLIAPQTETVPFGAAQIPQSGRNLRDPQRPYRYLVTPWTQTRSLTFILILVLV